MTKKVRFFLKVKWFIVVDKYLKKLKTQIREGTSILYDLKPLYLSLNLGQCGLKSTPNT